MSTLDIPVDIETSDISSALNSVVLSIFLAGMYTVIYFGTIYIYFTKDSSKYHPVPAAITLLYLSTIAFTGFQWYATKWAFVDNGDTRQSVFFAALDSPQWLYIAFAASNCIAFVIADGLLIWRCFYVWNRSLRIILVPLFLIIAEFALYLVFISFSARNSASTVSAALAARINDILSTALFMSFGTTIVTTVLIAYRIHSVSKQQGASSRRFKHITDIVVQSGAVYALSQLISALAGTVPGANTFSKSNIALQEYAQLLNAAIAGISPTVMVARVAMLSADINYPSTSVHVSGLQFHAHSTNPTINVEAMEITHSVDGDQSSTGEGQAVENKIQ